MSTTLINILAAIGAFSIFMFLVLVGVFIDYLLKEDEIVD
jgi:hypothetical protein